MDILEPNYPPPAFNMTPRDLADITDYIIHHEAGSLDETPLSIDVQHRGEGWAMIGYNYVIDPKGVVSAGRPLWVVPSAAYGRNLQSVNVSLVGNFEKGDPGYTGPPSQEQVSAIEELGLYLHRRFPTICRTIGHRDVARLFYNGDGDYATACPGSELYVQIPAIRSRIAILMKKY